MIWYTTMYCTTHETQLSANAQFGTGKTRHQQASSTSQDQKLTEAQTCLSGRLWQYIGCHLKTAPTSMLLLTGEHQRQEKTANSSLLTGEHQRQEKKHLEWQEQWRKLCRIP